MKKFILISAILLSLVSFDKLNAQQINININIGNQPAWGPIGYDYARYYYFPDLDCYYNVDLSLFYFLDRGRWVSARYLPYAYHHYDLYRVYKVVINDHYPWRHHHNHYKVYAKYRGNHNQVSIYRSNDRRYAHSRNNRVDWVAPKYRSESRTQRSETRSNGRSEVRKDNNRGTDKNVGRNSNANSQRYSRTDKATVNKNESVRQNSQRKNDTNSNSARFSRISNTENKSSVKRENTRTSSQRQFAESARISRR